MTVKHPLNAEDGVNICIQNLNCLKDGDSLNFSISITRKEEPKKNN